MAIGRKESFSIQLTQLIDAGLVWLAFWIADLVRGPLRDLFDLGVTEAAGLAEVSWVLYIAVPFTPLVLEFLGFYRRPRTKEAWQSLSQLVKGALIMALLVGLLAIFAKLPMASRLVLGVGALLVFVLIFFRDRWLHHHLRRRGVREENRERVLMAGSDGEIDAFLASLDEETRETFGIVGRFDPQNQEITGLYEILKRDAVERVIFAAGDTGFAKVSECVEICELQGVEAWIAASFIRTQVARPAFDVMSDQPMLVLRSTPELSWELFLKDVIDRTGALLIVLVTLPLWVMAWVGIKIASPGASAFFCQKRAGRYGRPFRMWKFRTMVPDADKMLERIKQEHGNQMEGPVFKLHRDPRIFPFGAFLRRLSIDELPQLLNVLRGEMSLVGPRPLPLYEVEAFRRSEHRRRLSVKPGITCEWQAGGRNSITSFEEWVEMDLRYIDNWSLWLDFKILLKTIPAVLLARGAK